MRDEKSLVELEREFIAIGVQVASRMQGLIQDILKNYEWCECGRLKEELGLGEEQDLARYGAFEKVWQEMQSHPDFDIEHGSQLTHIANNYHAEMQKCERAGGLSLADH